MADIKAARKEFSRLRQKKEETIRSFATRVKEAAEKCLFENKNEQLVSRFIDGVRSPTIKDALDRERESEEPTFDFLRGIAVAEEKKEQDASSYQQLNQDKSDTDSFSFHDVEVQGGAVVGGTNVYVNRQHNPQPNGHLQFPTGIPQTEGPINMKVQTVNSNLGSTPLFGVRGAYINQTTSDKKDKEQTNKTTKQKEQRSEHK